MIAGGCWRCWRATVILADVSCATSEKPCRFPVCAEPRPGCARDAFCVPSLHNKLCNAGRVLARPFFRLQQRVMKEWEGG